MQARFEANITFFKHSPQQIEIRRASENDVVALSAISKKTYQETYRDPRFTDEALEMLFGTDLLLQQLKDPEITFYLAFYNFKICGYCKVQKCSDSFLLDKIYLLENYQGRGLGDKLLNRAFEHAIKQGTNVMELKVYCKNDRAIQFYKKRGFVHTENSDYCTPSGEVLPNIQFKFVCDDLRAQLASGRNTEKKYNNDCADEQPFLLLR